MPNPERSNPYVGPAAFQRDQGALFFGREREAKKFLALISSSQASLLYSPSGAGKTSLLNARIIPRLEKKGIEVFPVARVGGVAPSELQPPNIYVFNVLSYLVAAGQENPQALGRIEKVTLHEFFENQARETDRGRPQIIVIDQFEEIVTNHPEYRGKREDFFIQIRQALQTCSRLSVVFAMREDHIAAIDRYTFLLPGRLRSRFRLERLRYSDAILAIRGPAERAERPFAENVAEELVDNLRQERLAGQEETIAGEFVEPVQLQVVCYQLWEAIKESAGDEITRKDIKAFGDVDRALEIYYDECLSRFVRRTTASEMQVRRWFGQTLITPSRIRSQVSRELETSGGLPNTAVDLLLDEHLIRSESVRGGIWYELVHDRFIDPILASNKRRFDQVRKAKRIRLLAAAATVVLLIAISLILVNQAQKRSALSSRSQVLASAALGSLTSDPQASLRKAVEAVQLTLSFDQTVKPTAEEALHQALNASRARLRWVYPAGEIESLALSPQGQRLAAAQLGGEVTVWNTHDATLMARLPRQGSGVIGLAFSPDAHRLATILQDTHSAVIWNLASALQEFVVSGHRADVNALTFSPDGRLIATASEDTTVRVWDAASGSSLLTLENHEEPLFAVAFSPDSSTLAAAGEDTTVNLWNVTTGILSQTLAGHHDGVHALHFNHNGSFLAAAGLDDTVNLWNVATREVSRTFPGFVHDVAFSQDDSSLITVDDEGSASTWNIDSQKELVILKGEANWSSAVFSGDGRHVAAASGGQIRLWSLFLDYATSLVGHTKALRTVTFSPDGSRLATVGFQRTAKLWDAQNGLELMDLSTRVGPVEDLAFSPDGTRAAIAGADGTVGVWSLDPWKAILRLPRSKGRVTAILFSPIGHRLVTANESGAVQVWNVSTGNQIFSMTCHEGPVHALDFSPDRKLLATAGQDGVTKVWDADSGAQRRTLVSPPGRRCKTVACPVRGLDFSPDGRRLVTAGADGTATIWSVATGQQLSSLIGHTEEVTAAVFSPDGRRLATGSLDRTVRLWKADDGLELFHLPGNTRAVYGLAYSPDGRRLAIAGEGSTVRIVPLDVQDLIELAQERTPSRPGE